MTLPTVGRIVHFYTTNAAQHFNGAGEGPYAAVVTQVFSNSPDYDTMANLKVMPPFGTVYDQGSAMEREQSFARGVTAYWWVWPPRDQT